MLVCLSHERKEILESMEGVHKVFGFSDADDTACRAIQKLPGYIPYQ